MNGLMHIEKQFNNESEQFEESREKYKNSIEELQDDMFDDFFNYVDENALYFTDILMTYLDELKVNLKVIYALKGVAKYYVERKKEREYEFISEDKLYESLKKNIDIIKVIKKMIQEEFRIILGVK